MRMEHLPPNLHGIRIPGQHRSPKFSQIYLDKGLYFNPPLRIPKRTVQSHYITTIGPHVLPSQVYACSGRIWTFFSW